MKTVGAFQAKTQLSQLLDQVEKGEAVTITRHGRPVAVLVPEERNLLINPAHPDFAKIKSRTIRPFAFDPRMFAGR